MIDNQQTTKQGYEIIAEKFSASRDKLWAELNIFKDYLKSGGKVLDLGCGNGRLVNLFKDIDVEYFGIDNNEKFIKIAKEKYPDRIFVQKDILEFNTDKKFDAIFMIASLNHFNEDDRKIILEKVYKLLKPGGFLLMTNWNMYNLKNKKSKWFSKTENDAVITEWKSSQGKIGKLVYYILTKSKIKKELKDFEILQNKYYTNGKKSNVLFGNNLLTVARKVNVECEIPDLNKKAVQHTACIST